MIPHMFCNQSEWQRQHLCITEVLVKFRESSFCVLPIYVKANHTCYNAWYTEKSFLTKIVLARNSYLSNAVINIWQWELNYLEDIIRIRGYNIFGAINSYNSYK